MRKINIKLLLAQGIVYRTIIIVVHLLFFWIITGKFIQSLEASLAWGVVNFAVYYVYHYFFLRKFKVGVDE